MNADVVEHIIVGLLQLRKINVFLDGLVLGTELCEASYDMDRAVQSWWCHASRRLCRSCKLRVEGMQTIHNLFHGEIMDKRALHTLGCNFELLYSICGPDRD